MLNRGGARSAAVRLPSLQKFAVMLVAFVALAIQTLVVQTHVHHSFVRSSHIPTSITLTEQGPAAVAVSTNGKSNGPFDPFSASDDPNCALCQGFAHFGQFVHSAAALAYIPVWVSVHFVVFKDVLPRLFAVSHNWQGRAPPHD
jgi:hypothetical protein